MLAGKAEKPINLTRSLQAIAANEDKLLQPGRKYEEKLDYEPLR